MMYITDVLIEKEFKSSGYDETDKEKVLAYLKQFKPCKFTLEPVIDVFSSERVSDADNGYSDGTYTWYESEIYHFEFYDLELNKTFIEYVMNMSDIFIDQPEDD